MNVRSITRLLVLGAAVGLPSVAMAQEPLLVTVFAAPGRIVSAPFALLGGSNAPAPDVYNPAPARAAVVSYTSDLLGVVPAPVLRQTGPRYDNPPTFRRRDAIVIRRGSTVPGFVKTAPARNITVAGLVPNGNYDFFVSPEQKIVFVDPATRQVAQILR